MPAVVETMFYVNEVPWHGLGKKLTHAPTVEEAITAADLDWEVGLKDLQTVDGIAVPNKATYRKTDGRILGVVGPRYRPLQNRVAFNWFQPFLDSGEVCLHTGGSLHTGEKVWVLAEIQKGPSEIVKGDEVAKFVLLSNSHNGTTAIRVGFTPIRVVCANTLSMAHNSDASKLIRIRHTKSAEFNLEKVREVMNLVNQQFEATAEQYRQLATKSICDKDVQKYVHIMLGVNGKDEDDIPTRTKNTRESILKRIHSGAQMLAGVRGTWWGAYNGYTEHLNYEHGRNRDNRMDKLWFNPENQSRKALTTALELSGVAAEGN